ncbi:hypothetical protein EDD11_005064 [Mortierella claussenii]|nr:hypothetical protein EDD11_005064 [Mortierella claussenii]
MNFFLYHTICTFHVIVPLLYWSYTSYEGEARLMALEISSDSLWRNYSFHGGDLIVVMIEVLINTMPFIPSHLTIVFFISLLYLAEAHIVHHVNGFWIYPFLDTSVGPIWLALYVGVGFVIMCAFCLMFYIHRLRNWIRARGKYQQQLLQAIVLENSQQYSSTGVLMGFDADPASLENEGGHDHDGAFAPYAAHPQIMAIQNQNRKRSDSDSSNYSTTSTLVGSDEDMGKESVSRRTSRKLQHSAGVDSSPAASGPQLEVVEEES